MNYRHKLAFVFFCLVFASAVNAGEVDTVIGFFKDTADSNIGIVAGFGSSIWYKLLLIEVALLGIGCIWRAIGGGGLNEFIGDFVATLIIVLFFFILLAFATEWLPTISKSFAQLGAKVNGQPATAGVSNLLDDGAGLAGAIYDRAEKADASWGMLLITAICSFCIFVAYLIIAAFVAWALIESYLLYSAAPLFIGFGALRLVRSVAVSALFAMVRNGAEIFLFYFWISFGAKLADHINAYLGTDLPGTSKLFVAVSASAIFAAGAFAVKEIGAMIGGGHSVGSIFRSLSTASFIASAVAKGVEAGIANAAEIGKAVASVAQTEKLAIGNVGGGSNERSAGIEPSRPESTTRGGGPSSKQRTTGGRIAAAVARSLKGASF